ncbi:hypothetical protein GGF32_004259 [Allomyces javanicus]|nr:hypothetical protein GGF32_006473 [Allomyces javanicus]KAJ3347961.1 hypothetical protein GGF32_006474 [Allomyces javanicus]KAJ3351530.1 hypothetical protein GGF32_004257 [Allomyces javanicus]KAJ3351531.1 hypothetical protein GGF32_004258 [Allomyces javanicus]KAJ3351532.1 hypothetical protein GGF32_004259 [Allomyces javanicus]
MDDRRPATLYREPDMDMHDTDMLDGDGDGDEATIMQSALLEVLMDTKTLTQPDPEAIKNLSSISAGLQAITAPDDHASFGAFLGLDLHAKLATVWLMLARLLQDRKEMHASLKEKAVVNIDDAKFRMGTKELAKSCARDALVDPDRVLYRNDDIEKDAFNDFVKTIADEDAAKEQERLRVQAVVRQIGQPNLAVVQPAQLNQSNSQQATRPPTLNWATERVAKKTIKSELNKAKSAMARAAKENRNNLPHLASRLFGDKYDDDLEKAQEWALLLRFCTLNGPTAQRKINDNTHPFQAASQDAHIWTLLGYVKQALDSMDQTDCQLLIARLKTWDTTMCGIKAAYDVGKRAVNVRDRANLPSLDDIQARFDQFIFPWSDLNAPLPTVASMLNAPVDTPMLDMTADDVTDAGVLPASAVTAPPGGAALQVPAAARQLSPPTPSPTPRNATVERYKRRLGALARTRRESAAAVVANRLEAARAQSVEDDDDL